MNINSSPNKIQVNIYKVLTEKQLINYIGASVFSFLLVTILGLTPSLPIVILIYLIVTLFSFNKNNLSLIQYVIIPARKFIKKNIYIK